MTAQNAFWEVDGLETCAFPFALVDEHMSNLKPTTIVLYLYLLRLTKRQGKVRVHTKDILWVTGLDKKTLTGARKQLKDCKLVVSVETTTRGIWEYEVLNPNTGGPLPSRENVDFAKLSDEVAFEFYNRLMPGQYDEQRGKFHCPFGAHAKATFRVVMDGGTDRHATWSCSKCRSFGGLIEFYRRLHKTSTGETHRRVRSLLQILMQDEQNARSQRMPDATPENSNLALI
jgi:hypothetical protein